MKLFRFRGLVIVLVVVLSIALSGIVVFADEPDDPLAVGVEPLLLGATPTDFMITTSPLPSGTVGQPYSVTLQTEGATGTVTWSLSNGVLPNGLVLNPNTGVLHGTPLEVYDGYITIRASEGASRSVSANLLLTIYAAPKILSSITVTTQPEKLSYQSGEKLSLSKMVVTANYSNSTSSPVTGYTTIPADLATLTTGNHNKTIEVSYTEGGVTKTAQTSPLTVKDFFNISTSAQTIDLNASTHSKVINVTTKEGKSLSNSDFSVVSSNSGKVTVTANVGNSFTIDVTSTAAAGDKATITVSGAGATAGFSPVSFDVSVVKNTSSGGTSGTTTPTFPFTYGTYNWSGNANGIAMKCSGEYADFTELYIDGNLLKRNTDYTVKAGSTIFTIKASYLKKLSNGDHTVTAYYTNGYGQTTLTINGNPKTGDESNVVLWGLLMVLALGILFVLFGRKRIEHEL